MRVLAPVLAFLLIAGAVWAVSVQEIGRLSELKTSDELILDLVSKKGLDKPITTEDVIYLREKGTSERVIQYLLKLSDSTVASQPAVRNESEKVGENLRSYTKTTKDGKTVRVITNLDENGKRMGGPVPPPMAEEPLPPAPPAPQEVHVTVTHESPAPAYEEEPEPESSDTTYYGGIPIYPYVAGPSYGYPGYPAYPVPHRYQSNDIARGIPQEHYRLNGSGRVQQQPRVPMRPAPAPARTAAVPTRPSHR